MGGAGGRRILPRLVAVAFAAVALAGVAAAVAVTTGHDTKLYERPRSTQDRFAPAPTGDARAQAVQALLDRRAAAVLHHDRAAFLATVDPGSAALQAGQGQLYDNLAQVPLATWRYELARPAARALPAAVLARYAAPAYAPAGVYLEYRLAGFDARPSTLAVHPTFVQRAGRWYLGGQDDLPGSTSAREPWDYGAMATVASAHVLVLGHPADRALLQAVDAEAERAVPRVDAVWGSGWSQRVVVEVPRTQQELRGIVGEDDDFSQIAAVATAELGDDPGGRNAVGDRVVVNPANFGKLGPVGRRVVVTHEITHVATRAATGDAMPSWLVEGFADYVGYRGTGVPTQEAARELADEVAAGHLPARLPADKDFDGSDPRLAQVYEEGWLACRMVAEQDGQQALVDLYRTVGAATSSPEAALADAMRRVLKVSPDAFTARWRAYLRAELS